MGKLEWDRRTRLLTNVTDGLHIYIRWNKSMDVLRQRQKQEMKWVVKLLSKNILTLKTLK